MNILILANAASGLLGFRRELVERLVADGHQVTFSVPENEEDANVAVLLSLGAKYVQSKSLVRRGTNPLRDLRLLAFYCRVIREVHPDVVLTYTIKPNVWGGLACQKTGALYIANITGLGTAVEGGGVLQKLTLALYKLGLRSARIVFFQNEMNRDYMVSKGVVCGRYDLLPGSGVNLEQFPPVPYPDGNMVNFTFISRVMEQKGIEQFLDTADALAPEYPETRFHVYGRIEDGYNGKLSSCIERGTVTYHGHADDMVSVYTSSSCVVHPSYYPEGMSNVLLEACASARPIITTGRPGCGEVVDDGINGFVVRERDAADLIDKVKCFLSLSVLEREAMGLAGRAKVEQLFDRQIVVERYVREIEGA